MAKNKKNRNRSKSQSQQQKANIMNTEKQQIASQQDSTSNVSNTGTTISFTAMQTVFGIFTILAVVIVILTFIVKFMSTSYENDLKNLKEKYEIEFAENIKQAKESRRIVALLSDFGVGSYYANMIKGKIIENHIYTNIIDISHEIRPFDVVEGAWILHNASQYFPDETIFWGMINPGAELRGNSIFFITEKPKQYFIGASRILFENVIANQGLEVAFIPRFEREDDKFGTTTYTKLINILLKGGTINDLQSNGLIGENITQNYKDENGNTRTALTTTQAIIWQGNTVSGYVCSIDRWGNLLTNIENKQSFFDKDAKYSVAVNSKNITGFIYGDSYFAGKDKAGVIIEQDGWIQIAMYKNSANDYFGLDKAGDKIVIRKEN